MPRSPKTLRPRQRPIGRTHAAHRQSRNIGRSLRRQPLEWRDVRAYLERQFQPCLSKGILTRWINALPACADGKLLGTCLAIDIAAGAIMIETAAGILRCLPRRFDDAREAFATAIEIRAKAEEIRCSSLRPARPLESNRAYSRVLTVDDFITYYVGPTYARASLNPATIAEIKETYLDVADGTPLGEIDTVWKGTSPVVWVVPVDRVERLRSRGNSPPSEPGDVVNDVLGLGYAVGNELLLVMYPPKFDAAVRCRPPTTVDAPWRRAGTFFVACSADDGWGRTQSCSGRKVYAPERVHYALKGLTNGFRSRTIGPIGALSTNRAGLLPEALGRLAGCIRRGRS